MKRFSNCIVTNPWAGALFGFSFVFFVLCSCLVADAGIFFRRRSNRHSTASVESYAATPECQTCTVTAPPLPAVAVIGAAPSVKTTTTPGPEKFTVHTNASGLSVRGCNGASCRTIPCSLERVPGDVDVFVLFPNSATRLDAIRAITAAHHRELASLEKTISDVRAKLEPAAP